MIHRGWVCSFAIPRFLPVLLLLAVAAGCAAENTALGNSEPQRGVFHTFPHYADRAVWVMRKKMKINDGDTFETRGVVIRILGLDTPELRRPKHGFRQGQPYGRQATARAVAIFDSAAVIEYVPGTKDRYGRTLAHVFVDGELFAVKMIEAGLAYETVSQYGDNGFPDLAVLITGAARKAGTPPFQNPYEWRRQHRVQPGESVAGILKKLLDWITR